MNLFIGLGNPGKQYQNTRHNIGHLIILKLIKNLGGKIQNSPKFKAEFIESNRNLFAISTEYMNLSGITAQKLLNFYKISPDNLYVIHDDLDLGVGEWRLQFDRGPAGHNGVKSIIDHLGTQAFWRFRVGIGHPRHSLNPNLPVEEYVLQPFLPTEKVLINETIDKIVEEINNRARS